MKGLASILIGFCYFGAFFAVVFGWLTPTLKDVAMTACIGAAVAWLSLSRLERMGR